MVTLTAVMARLTEHAATVNNSRSFAHGYPIKAPTRKHRTLISYQGDGTAMATNPEGKHLTLDTGSFTKRDAVNVEKLKDWAQLDMYTDIRAVVKDKRIKYIAGVPKEGVHPATIPLPTKLTVGDTVVDNGNITYLGKPVGTIKQDFLHGYHPIHRLILESVQFQTPKTFNKALEVDEFRDDTALVTYIDKCCQSMMDGKLPK